MFNFLIILILNCQYCHKKEAILQNTYFEKERDWLCSLELSQDQALYKDSQSSAGPQWAGGEGSPLGIAGEGTFISHTVSKEFLFKHGARPHENPTKTPFSLSSIR